MAAGQAFTVKTTFGIPIGPTYAGAVTVQPPAGGNNQPLIDQVITHSGSEQQIYEAVDHTKLIFNNRGRPERIDMNEGRVFKGIMG